MVRMLLGFAALLLAVSFALLPVERQVTEYDWKPAEDGRRVPLLLIERVPDEFELAMPCALIDGSDQELFASSRRPSDVPTLAVIAAGNDVVVRLPEDPSSPDGPLVSARLEINGAECEVVVTYDRAEAHLVIEADGSSAEVSTNPTNAFELTGLHWLAEDANDVRAAVRTSPQSMVRNSRQQTVLLMVLGILAVASLLLLLRGLHRWRPRTGWWRLDLSEWSMLLVALVVALVDLPRVDDGRILSRARHLANSGLSANVDGMVENRILPQRWLYEWVLGASVGWSNTIVVIRSLSVLCAFLSWLLLRRQILPALAQRPPSFLVVTVAWAVHALFVVAWFATLRPEPLVVALTIGVMAVLASWPTEPRAWPYTAVAICVGLALASHLAGVGTLLAALPVLWRLRDHVLRSPPPVLAGIAWGGACSIIAVFLGANLPATLAAAADFEEGGLHGYGALDALLYVSTVENSTPPMMLSAGLAFTAAAILFVVAMKRIVAGISWPADALVVSAALSPLGLLFTTSKWIWHLAVLAPMTVVGWALVAMHLDRRKRPSLVFVAAAIASLGFLMAWSLRPAWHPRMVHRDWRGTTLRSVSRDAWAERFPWLVGDDVSWLAWVFALAVVAVVTLWVLQRRAHGSGTGGVLASTMIFCVAAVAVIQLAPPVYDAAVAGSNWTFVRQSAVGLVSREDACGVPAATPALIDYVRGDPTTRSSSLAGGIAGHSMAYMYAPCHLGMTQRDGVWQVPPLLMGDPVEGQRRALIEYETLPIGCNDFPRDEHEQLCFFAFESEGEPLLPARSQWTPRGWR